MDEYNTPAADYEECKKDPQNYVNVFVTIPDLQAKIVGSGASNADVTLERTERSFCLKVDPTGNSKVKKYRYEVKKLPGDILTDEKKTRFKVKKGEVEIRLHKASPGTWAGQLASVGLEHADG